MKILRSVKHRDFTVILAGYFNVLTPGRRFTSSLPPGDFHFLASQFRGTAFPHADQNPATAPQFELLSTADQNDVGHHRLLRSALIVVAAIALTLFFAWWSGNCPTHITFFGGGGC
jgi:hypothetical protein